MKIVNLESQNVKRLKAVSITPDGNSVIIGGDNAQGKSSVLDSIFMALGGKAAQGQRPVRDGEEKATINCDLGDISVVRTILPNGNTTVKVKNAEGATFSSPQAMLDALSSKLTFDPLAFASEKPATQLEILKGLVGLDFADMDAKRKALYDNRTDINREGKECAARLDGMTWHKEAPAEPVSVSSLMEKLNEAENANQKKSTLTYAINENIARAKSLTEEIEAKTKELKSLQREQAEMKEKAENMQGVDTEQLREQISRADTVNAQVRENEAYVEMKGKVEALRKKNQDLSTSIMNIDKEKSEAMASASFPVEGLSFDDSGVVYNGVPFSQCSSSERLLVSLHMGIAMNPKLKVLLIRDGSLLDPHSLEMVARAADEADAQVWIERVSKGEECSIIIEDGEVVRGPDV